LNTWIVFIKSYFTLFSVKLKALSFWKRKTKTNKQHKNTTNQPPSLGAKGSLNNLSGI
jgi:hypothetical protein